MNITLDNLSKNDFTNVCRCCLSSIHLRPLFENNSKCDLLRNMLMNYTRLKLFFDDQLPKQICEQCSEKLIDFARFISNCNEINSVFLKLLDTSTAKHISTVINNVANKNVSMNPIMNVSTVIDSVASGIKSTAENIANPSVVPIQAFRTSTAINNVANKNVSINPVMNLSTVTDSVASGIKNTVENVANPSVVSTQAFRTWLIIQHPLNVVNENISKPNNCDNPQTAVFQTPVVQEENINGSQMEIHGNINDELEIKEELLDVKKEPEIKKEIAFEYVAVNSEENKDAPEPPIKLKPNFTCDICSQVFQNQVFLQWHKNEHNPKSKTYKCHKCSMSFQVLNTYLKHCSSHNKKKSDDPLKTKEKNKRQKSTQEQNKRQKLIQEQNVSSKISFYARLAKNQINKRQTLSQEQNKSIDASLESNESSERRELTEEQNVFVVKYMCNLCLNVFSDKLDLIEHKEKHGSEEKRCAVCLQLFANASELSAHPKTHLPLDQLFVCDICEKACKGLNSLQSHLNKKHFGQIKYLCDLCPKSFDDAKLLMSHRTMHCNICSKFFEDTSSFSAHENEHESDSNNQLTGANIKKEINSKKKKKKN